RTPLHWAAAAGKAECVRSLLDLGVDSSLRDINESAPLAYALHCGHAACVRLLARGGARRSLRTSPQPPGVPSGPVRRPEVRSVFQKASEEPEWGMLPDPRSQRLTPESPTNSSERGLQSGSGPVPGQAAPSPPPQKAAGPLWPRQSRTELSEKQKQKRRLTFPPGTCRAPGTHFPPRSRGLHASSSAAPARPRASPRCPPCTWLRSGCGRAGCGHVLSDSLGLFRYVFFFSSSIKSLLKLLISFEKGGSQATTPPHGAHFPTTSPGPSFPHLSPNRPTIRDLPFARSSLAPLADQKFLSGEPLRTTRVLPAIPSQRGHGAAEEGEPSAGPTSQER
uniref:Uncharacterized protein n=1 Tax=Myotis lucifugus TaxID=59463 RepID=G1PHA0_MYOLU